MKLISKYWLMATLEILVQATATSSKYYFLKNKLHFAPGFLASVAPCPCVS
jgi:hypothetical protein